jgi:hypothetical protein
VSGRWRDVGFSAVGELSTLCCFVRDLDRRRWAGEMDPMVIGLIVVAVMAIFAAQWWCLHSERD